MRFQDLTLEDQFLLDEAERAMANAYAPYSSFHVGAAIRTMQKRTYIGANMENAAYSMAICAERAALTSLSTLNDRAIEAVAVIATGVQKPTTEPVTPCGMCRQCLFEFADLIDRDFILICSDTAKSKIVVGTIRELLPRGFGPSILGVQTDRYRPLIPKPTF
jgi:cytidine deaminase